MPEDAYLDNAQNSNSSVKNSLIDTTKINNQGSANMSSNRLDATTFIWPARGSVITRFGHVTNSGKLEGVNIGTEKSAIVRSSSSGEIVFTDKVDGYDNVILIKHYNGFITAYGHVDPLVSVGDRVCMVPDDRLVERDARSIGSSIATWVSKYECSLFLVRSNWRRSLRSTGISLSSTV